MRLEWRASMSVGDKVLDGQHRQLLALLDGFRMAMAAGRYEAAEIAILEFDELAATHFTAEERLAASGDLYASVRHVAAHRSAQAHLVGLRGLIAERRNDEQTLHDITRVVFDIVIDLFSHDSDIRQRLQAPERRRFPRFPGNGLKADIAGRYTEVVDIAVNGMTIADQLASGSTLIVGLVPKIQGNLQADQRIEVSGTVLCAANGISTVVFAPDEYEKMWSLVSRIWRISTAV